MSAELSAIIPVVEYRFDPSNDRNTVISVKDTENGVVYYGYTTLNIPYKIFRIAMQNINTQAHQDGFEDGYSAAMQERDLDELEANKTFEELVAELPDDVDAEKVLAVMDGDDDDYIPELRFEKSDELQHPYDTPGSVAEPWDDGKPAPPPPTDLEMGQYGVVMRPTDDGNRQLVYDPEAYTKITAHQ